MNLLSNSMFKRTASDDYPYDGVLVGRRPKRMVAALEHIFDLSLQNSVATYITGDPGSGKSQLLYYLRRLFIRNKSRNMVIVHADRFNSQARNPLQQLSLLKEICYDENFRERAKAAGFDLNSTDDSLSESDIAENINGAVRSIEKDDNSDNDTRRSTRGLVIAIDGLDEYVRPSGGGGLNEQDTRALMFSVRFLLDSLLRTCIVLSFTNDVFRAVQSLISGDITFLRRVIPPREYDGTPLDFQDFNLEETMEMYSTYRDIWLDKAKEAGAEVGHLSKNPDWPISSDAIELAHEATSKRPGPLQEVFQAAFQSLLREQREVPSGDEYVGLIDMANVIRSESRTSPYGWETERGDVKQKIDMLREWTKRISNYTGQPPVLGLMNVTKALLEADNFKVNSQPNEKLDSTQLHVFSIEADSRVGRLGVIVYPDNFATMGDVRKLNDAVSDGLVHQIAVYTCKTDFHWIYSPSEFPFDHEGPRKRNLSNYSYVMRFTKEQFSGMGETSTHLKTSTGEAALWCANRLCSPVAGSKLSDVLSALSISAIRGANQ